MALLDTDEIAPSEIAGAHRRRGATGPVGRVLPASRRRIGVVLTVLGAGAQLAWLSWWASNLPLNAVAVAILVVELFGLLGTVAISVGLARARRPRGAFVDDRRESHRFAFAVADIVGGTRSTDVHSDVARVIRTMPYRRRPRSAELAMCAVLLEGLRRLLLVVAVSVALLLGIAPLPMPPVWALATLVVAVAFVSTSHVVLGDGRIRFGDRIRWSYSSIGEVVCASDPDGVAPRRWVGTMASIVVVNLAIALRGTSDRWTHGLDPMTADARLVTMTFGFAIVIGALFTMGTVRAPVLDADRWSRRLEERTARQSALAATVVIGLVGLVAGVLPGDVDTTDDDTTDDDVVPIEQVVEDRAGVEDG